MLISRPAITPLNECSALVSFGNTIDVRINKQIIALHRRLVAQPFAGFIESVPAYSSLAVFYRPDIAFDFVQQFIQQVLDHLNPSADDNESQIIEIPVLYDGEDLAFVAQHHGLTKDEVISLHTALVYRVFMIGFLPGFAYMGMVDARIATPRKSSPRTGVPAGSVGITGLQTGIYPQSSPGGWQLIGRTPLRIFNRTKSVPCLFNPGDSVRYIAIDHAAFEKLNEY